MAKEEKNPYADANGNAKPGMLPAFMQWVTEQENKRREKLPMKELNALKKLEKHTIDKMSS
jgi:hypothetical protein